MRLKIVLLSMLMLGLVLVLPSEAKHKKAEQGTFVTAVDQQAKTLTLTLRRSKQGTVQVLNYKIDPAAIVTIDGSTVPFSKVHTGLKVTGYTEGEKDVLVSLDLQN